jgi:hypothetical protein
MAGLGFVGAQMAGAPPSNTYPRPNWGNGGGGRGSDSRASGAQGYGAHKEKLPASAATPGNKLTFERMSSIHCESDAIYPVDNDEKEFATHHFVCALESTRALLGNGVSSGGIIEAFAVKADNDYMTIQHVKFHQLKLVARPSDDLLEAHSNDLSNRDLDASPDGYDTFKSGDKTYAVNPGGRIYEVLKKLSWDWTLKILVVGDLDFNLNQQGETATPPVTYAVRLSVTKQPKDIAYLKTKMYSKCLLLEYGEIVADYFVPWSDKVYISDKELVGNFSYSHWKPLVGPQPDEEAVETRDFTTSAQKYEFSVIDDATCVFMPGKGKNDEGKYMRLGNFAIDGVMNIYQFADREKGLPWIRYKVHAVLDPRKEEIIYVTPEMDVPLAKYRNIGRIDAEVLVPINEVDDKTLSSWFSKVSAYLQAEGYFKVEHLKSLTNALTPWPRITRVVTHFGRQPNSSLFVFGNTCYARGKLYSHEEAGITVLPHMFGGKEVVIPMPLAKFPKLLLVEQEWVRYAFFVDFYANILPGQFLNNTMQAKATFALGVMQLQTSKFWCALGRGSLRVEPIGAWSRATRTRAHHACGDSRGGCRRAGTGRRSRT